MTKKLATHDLWIENVDMDAFKEEMDALGRRLRSEEGAPDKAHLNMIINLCDILLVVGLAGLGLSPAYVFPWVFLGMALTVRWTSVMHHISHGGYSRSDPAHARGVFAVGGWYYRARDWLDWMLPEAWDVEHNTLHHYSTNEKDDPDLVQRNFATTRDWDVPVPLKYVMVYIGTVMWKWMYYAANTWKHLQIEKRRRSGEKISKAMLKRVEQPMMIHHIFGELEAEIMEPGKMFVTVYLPYILIRMVLPSVVFYVLAGWEGCLNAMTNIFLAELWANLHSFCLVVPNHAGDDMYHFSTHVKPNTATFYMRQIIGSVNYHTGSDPKASPWWNNFVDVTQGWLNYQIEHHCYPNMSMVSYRKAQPEVKVWKKHPFLYTFF